ncbi:membrane protein [Shewanella sp. NFH-SH190041]|uniref:hypothetical protein n=1 Tax=Shewanella sp. NFH-SH190041 TaxID=2950245 RepID=UPI0021C43060|nr:hypothetical protein [Shewanella sp. NFH-SH190041]BDM63182.1 membrane protein [Shewanella sp. NFH-SH190041]
MICPNCNKAISVTQIQAQRGKGLHAEFQCPHCQAWLGRTALLMRFKILGFYLAVIMAIVTWIWPHTRHFGIPVAIMALILLLVSHLMDQLKVTQVPEPKDDSEQRQKYR